MSSLSIGKIRGLQQLANAKGILTICALDHRGSLQKALNKERPEAVTYQDMVDFKLDLCRAIAPFASAVLLDPLYGMVLPRLSSPVPYRDIWGCWSALKRPDTLATSHGD